VTARRAGPAIVAALAGAALVAACSSAPGSDRAGAPSLRLGAATTSTPTIAGCSLFPVDNPWRRDISTASVHRHSTAWVRSVGTTGHLHADFGSDASYGIPFQVVPADQTKVPITFTAYGDESDPGQVSGPADREGRSGQ
jgi:hypothetical protein